MTFSVKDRRCIYDNLDIAVNGLIREMVLEFCGLHDKMLFWLKLNIQSRLCDTRFWPEIKLQAVFARIGRPVIILSVTIFVSLFIFRISRLILHFIGIVKRWGGAEAFLDGDDGVCVCVCRGQGVSGFWSEFSLPGCRVFDQSFHCKAMLTL